MPAIDIKRVAADTHLTTDVMILDHLIHKATKAILNEITEKDVDKSNRRLHRVNDFLLIFNANHQQRLDIPDTQFRLQLLQFATLFFAYRSSNARLPPMRSVAALRQQNEARASKWDQPNEGNVDEALSSTTTLQSKGLLLLDILPLFMRLSIQIAHDPPSEAWMRLAVAFMQYAVVEAICSVASSHEKVKRKTFRFNSLRGKIVREAFIWGSPKTSDGGDDDEAEFHDVLSMEGGGPGSTVRKWRDVREEGMSKLKPLLHVRSKGIHARKTMRRVKRRFVIAPFREQIRTYLAAMAESITPGKLQQLEAGRLENFSVEQTRMIKQRIGIDSWDNHAEDVEDEDS